MIHLQYLSDSKSTWNCTHCDFSTNGQAVQKILKIIQAEVDTVEAISGADGADAILERETVMKKYRSILHPHHAFLTILRYDKAVRKKSMILIIMLNQFSLRHSLTQMYGRVDEYLLDDLPDVVLEHKVDMCRLLLQVLDIVEPGYSRIRGTRFLCIQYVLSSIRKCKKYMRIILSPF